MAIGDLGKNTHKKAFPFLVLLLIYDESIQKFCVFQYIYIYIYIYITRPYACADSILMYAVLYTPWF